MRGDKRSVTEDEGEEEGEEEGTCGVNEDEREKGMRGRRVEVEENRRKNTIKEEKVRKHEEKLRIGEIKQKKYYEKENEKKMK